MSDASSDQTMDRAALPSPTPEGSPRDWKRSGLLAMAVVVLLAAVAYPVRRYVVEPERQALLGYREPPGRRLALASQFGFDTAAGSRVRLVPGLPALSLGDLPAQTVMTILGGFRGPYVVRLWISVQDAKQRRDTFELLDLYKKILLFQGDYPGVWSFVPWDMVWNVPVQWGSLERKYQWMRTAIVFVNEGYRRHPQSAEIMEAMGRIYSEKLGRSQEADYYRKRIEEDEGRSVFRIAYDWYDRCRRTNDRYNTLGHYGLTKPVVYSQACHCVSYYAKELAQRSYDTFQSSLEARENGREAESLALYEQGLAQLLEAVKAWDWARREWGNQALRFEKEGVPAVLDERYRHFYGEADDANHDLEALCLLLNYDNLPELFDYMYRPEIE